MVAVRFILPDGSVRVVEGEPGLSVMQVATGHGVPGIASDCGGCVSCGTCHAWLTGRFAGLLPPPAEAELAMIENLVDPRPNSRLTCQVLLAPGLDGIEFTVPPSRF